MEIKEALRTIVYERNGAFGVVAEVLSVSGTTCTVSPIDGSADIEDVRLQTEAASGILCIPVVGSFVVVQMLNDVEGVVVMFSELESIKFLDGSYGGLVKIIDLVTKINNLEDKVNTIISTFNSHVHTGVTTGGGSSGTTPTTVSGTLTQTVRGDIENTEVTHGTV